MASEMYQAEMWDERFAGEGYAFGTEPSPFLRDQAHLFAPGKSALLVGDGEGRNSVFAAQHGAIVTAMDISPVGVSKARALASDRGVSIDAQVADILTWDWTPNSYDLVAAVFIQFLLPDQRAEVFNGMRRTLRPGGYLLVHGYRPEQIEYGTGGPKVPEAMYTEELLRTAFEGFTIERLASYDLELDEGTSHRGPSALIDLVARKPG